MSDLDRLYAQIVAAPSDLAPRRAYEAAIRGTDPLRADFIALQLEVREAAQRGAPRPSETARRARALLAAHPEWSGEIASKVASLDFYGGFVESVELGPAQMANGHDLAALAPLRHLRTRDLHGKVDALLALPFLPQILTLDVGQNKLDTADVMQLAAAPALAHLVVLDLGDNPITDDALRALAQLPRLRYVETQGSNAPLFTRSEDLGQPGPVEVTESYRTLVNELGPLEWLDAEQPPPFDSL